MRLVIREIRACALLAKQRNAAVMEMKNISNFVAGL